MKRLAMIVVLLLTTLSIFPSYAMSSSKKPFKLPLENFRVDPAWQKLDLRLQKEYSDAASLGMGWKRFDCIVKLDKKPDAAGRDILKRAGFDHRSVIGSIATGGIKAYQLRSVAALENVKSIELSALMNYKKGAGLHAK